MCGIRIVSILVGAALFAACAAVGVVEEKRPWQRSPLVDVEQMYIFGYHGESWLGLNVTNRTDRPLRARLYVTLPQSHPPQSGLDLSREQCSGLQEETELAAREKRLFQSCMFYQLASRARYELTLVVRDGAAGMADSLTIPFDAGVFARLIAP